MSNNQIKSVKIDIAKFFVGNDIFTVSQQTVIYLTTEVTAVYYTYYCNGKIAKEGKFEIGRDIDGLFCLSDHELGIRHEFNDSPKNKQITTDQPMNKQFTTIQSMVDHKSTDDNVSIADTDITEITSDVSNSNTIVLSYAEKAKKSTQNEDSKKFIQIKDSKKSTQKKESKIDTLVKLVLEFLTTQHKHSIRFNKEKNQICVTANKDIRELLVKLTDPEVDLFESEINRRNCDKDIKFSIGPSTTNPKFTKVLKAHHALVEVSL